MNNGKKSNTANTVSFWGSKEKQVHKGSAVSEDITVDVAIIGGGFTGLSTAREILRDEPTMKVAVLESHQVGYGASGRNGGFNMTLFGLEPDITMLRWGKDKSIAAQDYMERAVDNVRALVKKHNIKSDYEHTGMVRVAYSDPQLKRLEHSLEMFEKLGTRNNYTFQEKDQIQSSIHSPQFKGGVFEANSGILNPYKHVRELKRIAEEFGASIYENTPVENVERKGEAITLHTPKGKVTCKKLVIAVNAWSGKIQGLPRIRNRQTPVWTSQVVTKPLSAEQWKSIGWDERQSIEDNRQLIHYFRRTACGRFTMGGGRVSYPKDREMATMDTSKTWDALEAHTKWLFPQLTDIDFEYRWGGPVSVNLDMAPEIGFIGDERVIYANGCIGHGVAITQLNGRTIADLVLEKKTELSDIWIVNRKAIPWPPGLLGSATFYTIIGALSLWDKIEERKLVK